MLEDIQVSNLESHYDIYHQTKARDNWTMDTNFFFNHTKTKVGNESIIQANPFFLNPIFDLDIHYCSCYLQ